jgi:hypothetical protein
VKLRTRIAVALTFLLLLLGLGAGTQANATSGGSSTNGCVVVPSLQLAACLGRF